jgi:hypothetical protein
MTHELGKRLAWGGVALYLLILVFQLYYFLFYVGFLLLPLLALLVQIGFGIPVVMVLQKKIDLPLLDYAKGLALLVSALAVSGYLGLSERAVRIADDGKSYRKAELSIREALGDVERLDLAIDLAAAKTEDEKKKVNEALAKIDKDLSEADKESYRRELAVLKEERERSEWGSDLRRIVLNRAQLDNGLVVLGAFLILLGALVLSRPENAPRSEAP